MPARIPPYRNTLGACAFVVVFGPLYNTTAAVLWYFLVIVVAYASDFPISAESLAAFKESHGFLIKLILMLYFGLATFVAVLVVAALFRRANLKTITMLYVGLSVAMGFLLLAPLPLIGGLLVNGMLGTVVIGVMCFQYVRQMTPPPDAQAPSLDGSGEVEPLVLIAKDTKTVRRARRILAWILVLGLLVFALSQAAAKNLVAAGVLVATGPGVVLLIGLWIRKRARNPLRLEIDRQGLSLGGAILPWADAGRAWVHRQGRYETLRIETSRAAERAFLDRNRAKGSRASALMVWLKGIFVGLSSVAIPLAPFEASGAEILAAIARARRGGPETQAQAG